MCLVRDVCTDMIWAVHCCCSVGKVGGGNLLIGKGARRKACLNNMGRWAMCVFYDWCS